MASLFKRTGRGPILTADDLPFHAAAVLNPGVTEQDGEVVMLVRVEYTTGRSNIHVARSRNGVDQWRIETEPILRHGEERWPYESWGCEDARVTYLEEHEAWYIIYTAASALGPAVALARSRDLASLERIGLIFAPNNKDAVLLPRRCRGRYAVLHRPDAGGIEHIWSAYSTDLIHWGEPHCVVQEGVGPAWDAKKIGAGPPPILTDRGWLTIYHGVKVYGGRFLYRAGIAVLDRDAPHKLVQRCPQWVFQAHEPYELSGLVPGVIFPSGMLQRGDELWMYYGAADTYIGLAIARLPDVLALLDEGS
ncbi:MAG: hypothetical protein WDZ31_09690 [Phycisphaeraceae bacterium]